MRGLRPPLQQELWDPCCRAEGGKELLEAEEERNDEWNDDLKQLHFSTSREKVEKIRENARQPANHVLYFLDVHVRARCSASEPSLSQGLRSDQEVSTKL